MKYRQAIRSLQRAGWKRHRKSATAHAIWKRGNESITISEHDPLCTTAIKKIRRAIA